jgi:3-oxoacyl-[acyl-carrier protein] reductase
MSARDEGWVVVSGAAGALGSALAAHYCSRDRRVLALDRRFDPAKGAPKGLVAHEVDLLSEEDVRQAIAQNLGAGEGISLLINAVGQIWSEPLLAFRGAKLATHRLDTWRSVQDANLTAPFIVATQVAARMVRHGGGCIVNFSSIASDGNAGQAAYSAAKAGIEGLTRTMAIELGPLGVRVNAVALGFIDVSTTREAVPENRLQQYAERNPLGRLGRPEEVLSAVEFLATNSFVNGTIVKVDGGLRL